MGRETLEISSEPLSWAYSADSVMKHDLRLLCLLGVWSLPQTPLYRVFSAFVVFLGLFHIAEAVISLVVLGGGLQEYTMALISAFLMVMGLAKMSCHVLRPRRYFRLVRWLDALVTAQENFARYNQELLDVSHGARRTSARITVGLNIYNVVLVVCWWLVPLTVPPELKRLPFQQLPVDFPLYGLSYALQALSVFFIGILSMHMDCFFMTAMIHTASQLKILSLRITNLQQQQTATKEPEQKSKEKSEKSTTEENAYAQLCLCIQTHQRITSFAEHLTSVMSPVAALQFTLGVFNGCMLIFPAAYSGERNALVKCVVAFATLNTQLLLYCLGAHSVREEGEEVSMAAFNSDWPDASRSFRHALLIVMTRAQKPLELTAGGIYPIQRSTFLSLLNAGYSYYAVLQNFNGR